MKKSEVEKKEEIKKAKMEVQQVKDRNDVQIKKLEDDLKIYETEMKKARFVFENYEREVTRWRKEVEDQENGVVPEKKDYLDVPSSRAHKRCRCSTHRESSCCNRSRSRSRSKSKNPDKENKPFKRIARRASKNRKENENINSNMNLTVDTRKISEDASKALKPKSTQLVKNKTSNSKQNLKIKRPKSGRRKRI